MNGVHDLGGMHGCGPIEREDTEPAFRAEGAEAVLIIPTFGLMGRCCHRAALRQRSERRGHARDLATRYYEHWLAGVETLLVEKGVLTRAELDARAAEGARNPEAPRPDRRDPELLEQVMRLPRMGSA